MQNKSQFEFTRTFKCFLCKLTSVLALAAIFAQPTLVQAQVVLFSQEANPGGQGVISLYTLPGDPQEAFSTGHVTQVTFDTDVVINKVTTFFTNQTGAFGPDIVTVDIFDGAPLSDSDLIFTGGDFGVSDIAAAFAFSNGLIEISNNDPLEIFLPKGTYWIGLTPQVSSSGGQQEFLRAAGTSTGTSFYRNPSGVFGTMEWTNNYGVLGQPANFTAPLRIEGEIVSGGGFESPASYSVFRGVELSGDLTDFESADDVRASYNPGFTINTMEAPVWLIFDATADGATDFHVESQAGTPGLEYTVEAFNWASGSYEVIGVQTESFNTDAINNFAIVPADHIDPSGNVRSRIGWRRTGFTIIFPWEVRVDQVGWNQ